MQVALERNRLWVALLVCLWFPPSGAAATIVLIGDSITQGNVAGGGRSFADQLQALRPQDQIRNAGCAGSTTGDWIRPVGKPPSCTIAGAYTLNAKRYMPADIAIIMLGANDSVGYFELSPIEAPEYRSNLEKLVQRALQDVERVALLTPTRNPIASLAARERLSAYRDVVLELCGLLDRVLCGPDFQETLSGPKQGLAGLHPNEQGHRRIAEQLDEFLTKLAQQ